MVRIREKFKSGIILSNSLIKNLSWNYTSAKFLVTLVTGNISGNFSSGNISGNFSGSKSGNNSGNISTKTNYTKIQ